MEISASGAIVNSNQVTFRTEQADPTVMNIVTAFKGHRVIDAFHGKLVRRA
jgi:hypothetical protein